jgi:hypothetical protein
LVLAAIWLFSARAGAAAMQAPVGGAPVAIPGGKVVCGSIAGEWTVESSRTRIRPPKNPSQVGRSTEVVVAANLGACTSSKDKLTLGVTGPLPQVDRRSVELMVDEGRLDLRGTDLEATELFWQARGQNGSDSCVSGAPAGAQQTCSFTVSRQLPADTTQTTLWLLPAGARLGIDTFDAQGNSLLLAALQVTPARIVISRLMPRERVLDVSTGEARLELGHPEAVASVECSPARCELSGREILVRAVTGALRSLAVRGRLLPRVFMRAGEHLVDSFSSSFDLAFCPLSLSSGPPLREVDDLRVAVRMDARCGASARDLHWTANGNGVGVLDVENAKSEVHVLLGVGRIASGRLVLSAARADTEGSVVALTTVRTTPPPRLRTSLELPGYGAINFIPTNRDAVLGVNAVGLRGTLVPLPVAGAYEVSQRDRLTRIRAAKGAGGYVALRFAYRDPALPGRFAQADLAHLVDAVQRRLEEANLPAPIGASVAGARPIIALECRGESGGFFTLPVGETTHIRFDRRDSCRVVIHRRRIRAEDGEQRLDLAIEVISTGGTSRPEGHLTHRLVMRHGEEDRVIWISGVQAQYDRINVRVTHVVDETQYLRGQEERLALPAAHWTAIVADTHFRFYATAAIPVSLFRFAADPKGVGNGSLSLNVGMLSRLTWLTRDGTEGLFGLEAGVMGMGLAADNQRQLNIVAGISLSVPLGNARQLTQAAVNVHAWAAYRLGSQSAELPAPLGGVPETIQLEPWAFIFGPSITIGNIGLDL